MCKISSKHAWKEPLLVRVLLFCINLPQFSPVADQWRYFSSSIRKKPGRCWGEHVRNSRNPVIYLKTWFYNQTLEISRVRKYKVYIYILILLYNLLKHRPMSTCYIIPRWPSGSLVSSQWIPALGTWKDLWPRPETLVVAKLHLLQMAPVPRQIHPNTSLFYMQNMGDLEGDVTYSMGEPNPVGPWQQQVWPMHDQKTMKHQFRTMTMGLRWCTVESVLVDLDWIMLNPCLFNTRFPNFEASATTGLPATTVSPPNSTVRRSVRGTAKAAATPKAASRNPTRRRECLIVTVITCHCMMLWAMGQATVEIRASKSSCRDGVGFCVPSGLFQVSCGQQRRQSFLHFEATLEIPWNTLTVTFWRAMHFSFSTLQCPDVHVAESLMWSLHLSGTLLTPSSSAPCRSLPSQQLAAIPPTWSLPRSDTYDESWHLRKW